MREPIRLPSRSPNDICRLLLALVATTVAVVVCYFWLDRPIATWVHAHVAGPRSSDLLEPLTHYPNPLIAMSAAAYLLVAIAALARRISRGWRVLVVCSISAVMGELIKNELKWVFGRAWPESWKNNPSFIRDDAYGFHWFGGGGVYNSFPSGHMTLTAAILAVLWMGYPRWRAAYVLLAILAGVGLVGSNFHFLGDVIAGGCLGAAVGLNSFKLFDADWLANRGK